MEEDGFWYKVACFFYRMRPHKIRVMQGMSPKPSQLEDTILPEAEKMYIPSLGPSVKIYRTR
jgi:hypothetical protein